VRTDRYISIQSTALWRPAFFSIAKALPVYQQNLGRAGVAGTENTDVASAIILLVVSLESHVNRLMYFVPNGLTTDVPLFNKVERYLPGEAQEPLRTHLDELLACRDAVTHALVWVEEHDYTDDWRLLDQRWQLADVTQLRARIQRCVDLAAGGLVTRQLAINVIPTNVNILDVVKALIVVCRVMRELEHDYGNPHAWVGPFPSAEELVQAFLGHERDDDLEGWIAGLLRQLDDRDREDILQRFGIGPVRYDGVLHFVRISRHR
jgi:hypothetical protein